MASKFGSNLKKVRTEKGISQQKLANMLNVHYTHISRYERNIVAPSIDTVKEIAESLDVPIDALIYGQQNERAKNNLKDKELLDLFTKVQLLDKKDLDTVRSMLKTYVSQKKL